MMFDTFNNRSVITGKIVAIDPLHIGASGSNALDPTAIDDAVLKDSRGRAVIPGSSLKGVVRSYFESILRSVYGSKGACNVFDKEQCCEVAAKKPRKMRAEPMKRALPRMKAHALHADCSAEKTQPES